MGNKTWKIWIVLAGIILTAAVVLGVLYSRGFFYKSIPIELTQMGLTAQMKEYVQDKHQERKERGETIFLDRSVVFGKSSELLGKSSDVYMCSWYLLSGGTTVQPAEQSAYYLCEDQILLANAWIELGEKAEARKLLHAIYEDFGKENGYLSEMIEITEVEKNTKITDTYDDFYDRLGKYGRSVKYINAWFRYYKKWGTGSDWRTIKKIAEELIPIQKSFPEDFPIEGTFKKYVDKPQSATRPETFFSESVGLAGLMPETMEIFIHLDQEYNGISQQADAILAGGQISKEVPLYAIGYQNESGSYFYSNQIANHVDLKSSLYIMNELAKQGELEDVSIQWLKKQLYTSAGFVEKYEIISGVPVQTQESVESYGIVMQIARIIEDDNLYALGFDKLINRLATHSQSSARGAIYRTTEDGRILIRARDNLEAVIGLGE